MSKLYHTQRARTPAKIEVGVVNNDGVTFPLAYFVWDEGDQYEWAPDMVIPSANWGIFKEHVGFVQRLVPLSGFVLKPDMMCKRLADAGCVALDSVDCPGDFDANRVFSAPSRVGLSSYRAIYEILEDIDDWDTAAAELNEFKAQADAMLKNLEGSRPNV